MNPKNFDEDAINFLRDMILRRLSEECDFDIGDEEEDNGPSKILSKKDECIANMEDFIELVCALCPSEEELIRHRGNELIKEISRL